ncbi:MAG: hypothetical protein A2275_07585 [Bacteroidetes bacterium RIFOXYA12_FULL_35_11]|nr:MAG: hypothetical protein A2275_07585 [Bacteroidetes bacterium RIFOXYA12_FULL_35_11]
MKTIFSLETFLSISTIFRTLTVVKICIFILPFLFLASCQEKPKKIPSTAEEDAWSKFDKRKMRTAMMNRLNTLNDVNPVCHTEFENFDSLKIFYQKRNFELVWTKQLNQNTSLDTLMFYLRKAYLQGIDSSYYDLDFIKMYFEEYNKTIHKERNLDYFSLANLELFLSNAALLYTDQLKYGVVNPAKLFPETYKLPLKKRDSLNFFQPLLSEDIGVFLRQIQPRSAEYNGLIKALQIYRTYQEKEGWDSIPNTNIKLKLFKGDTFPYLKRIAERLLVTGELDSVSFSKMNFLIYDTILYKAILKYQLRNGLLDDGVIGYNTINEMNTSVSSRIRQIELNLERQRWLQYPDSGFYVKVNVPDFYLFAYDSGKVQLDMRVCCGERKTKDRALKIAMFEEKGSLKPIEYNHETPTFFSSISHFIINPQWTVPENIVKKEMIFKIIQDSSYLKDNNFRVFYRDVEVDPKTVNWKKYRAGNVPYKFMQEAGDINALGKLKFVFYNPFSVYMHDTPSKHAFRRTTRAVSHGCIRLEKPFEFAEFLMRYDKKFDLNDLRIELGLKPEVYKDKDKEKEIQKTWYQKQADKKKFEEKKKIWEERQEAIKKGELVDKTKKVVLKKNVPVYIDYYTSWLDAAGIVQFRPDVYYLDLIVSMEMERKRN